MELVSKAVDEMIAGLSYEDYGIAWSKPVANYSGQLTRTWQLSESLVQLDESKSVNDKIREETYDDLVTLVVGLEQESERELTAFSINTAVLTRAPLDTKTKRYTYTLRFSYYLAL